jgi:DNA-binding transcriptional ArsR family regulator
VSTLVAARGVLEPRSVTLSVLIVSARHGPLSSILNQMVHYQPPVDRVFAALADPNRRAVVERLGSGRASISELAEPSGMSLTGMKKHIRLLEEAELVRTEKVGRVRMCMLAPYAFEGINTWLARLDRFALVAERTKGDQ